jgi:hypothetical protein
LRLRFRLELRLRFRWGLDCFNPPRRCSVQHAPNPLLKDLPREGLDDIVVCSDIVAFDPILVRGARGQHNDRSQSKLRYLPQATADLIPLHARHDHIENNEIGSFVGELFQSLLAVIGEFNLVSLCA